MCESKLLIENELKEPDSYFTPIGDHSFTHTDHLMRKHILIDKFSFGGNINYAAAYEIKDMHGIKSGYMLIVGEK